MNTPGWVALAYRDTETRTNRARFTRDVRLAGEVLAAADEALDRAARLDAPARLDATAAVRLAERTVGLVIRAAQDAGEVQQPGDNRGVLPSGWELAGFRRRGAARRCYELADMTDEEFAAAMTAARAGGNLSRAAVLRHVKDEGPARGWVPTAADRSQEASVRRRVLIRDYAGKGWSSRQMQDLLGTDEGTIRRIAREMGVTIRADHVVARTARGHQPTRIAEETVTALDGLASAVELIDPADIDPARARAWAASLTESLRVLNRFAARIKETARVQ